MIDSKGFDMIINNSNTDYPNVYIVSHGNSPSTTIDTSKIPKKYHYNGSNYDTTIPPGYMLVIFTPENTQQWGSTDCLKPDLDAFRSDWHKTDHPFAENAKIFLPGENYINMCLKFEPARYFNIYNINTGEPLTHSKKVKNKSRTTQLKSEFPKSSEFTLEYLFDTLVSTHKQGNHIQIIYLMACNPFPVTVDDAETKNIVAEHAYVTHRRSILIQKGRNTFERLVPNKKLKWNGIIRPGGDVSKLNTHMITNREHPFFTMTANNITTQFEYNAKTEADQRKSAIAVLSGLTSQQYKSPFNSSNKSKKKSQKKSQNNKQKIKTQYRRKLSKK